MTLVASAIATFILVRTDELDRGWACGVLPMAILAPAATRVLTPLKAVDACRRTL
jgi:hypothetical protein